ncbi:MAG: sulfite exporter TauE/SafE family protein [Alphaproteobacteria bacterium]|nr:sulfite exporter TauE/SafE family protein [Alphaproteobacteria bacterium]
MALAFALVLSLVAATSFISGIFGVAGGLILMGGLVYLLPVSQAMIVHGVAQFVSNGSRVYFWRQHLAIDIILKFALTSFLCLGAFAFLRFVPSKTLVLFLLGISTVVLFFVPDRWAPRITQRGVAYGTGAAATALMLMAGVSGPFLDQFFVRSGLDRRVTIATKAAMQCVSHIVKIAYFGALAGNGLDEEWWLLAGLAPFAAVAGSSAAAPVLHRMTDKQFYWWTRRIVLVLGVYYIVEAIRSWLA